MAAVVGPNGAGKTTLMRLAVGLRRPTRGSVTVFGHAPRDDPASLARVGFVAQETPLYRDLPVADHLEMCRRLNGDAWDQPSATARLGKLSIPLDRRVGELSGGQQAQVALTIALAKRPDLLVLDEPVASLDPLARRTFLSELMGEVATRELTVLLSSHLIADLEHRCDYLVILSDSRVQVLGDVDDLLATHAVIVGPADAPSPTPRSSPHGAPTASARSSCARTDRCTRRDGRPNRSRSRNWCSPTSSEPGAGTLPGPEGPA